MWKYWKNKQIGSLDNVYKENKSEIEKTLSIFHSPVLLPFQMSVIESRWRQRKVFTLNNDPNSNNKIESDWKFSDHVFYFFVNVSPHLSPLFSFNLPRVTAQLEKLMGTNVVRLTDRKYMQELQKRIKEDYCATLEKRINNRVVSISVLGQSFKTRHVHLYFFPLKQKKDFLA